MRSSSVTKCRAFWLWFGLAAAASSLSAQDLGEAHPGQYTQNDVIRGSEVYRARCAACHGLAGNALGVADLSRGRFRRAVSDQELEQVIRAGVPESGMPPFNLDDTELIAVVAFLRAGLDVGASAVAVRVGDMSRGRAIFEGKGECLSCHRVHGVGARSAAPDLSDIGTARPPEALMRSLVDPTSVMIPINRPIRAITHKGEIISGRRLNEDTYTVQLVDEEGRLVSLLKADLREYEILLVSPMPSYQDKLTPEELADVLAYLLSLRD